MSVEGNNKSKGTEVHNTKPDKIFQGMASTLLKHGFLLLRAYFDMLIDFVFSLFWDRARTPLPGLEKKHNLLSKSAVELAEMIRKKELKSEQLVQACIERINIVNPILNAVTDERFEHALKEAREIDAHIEKGLTDDHFKTKPFLGVPFTCKESHAVRDMRHTLGVASRRDERAREDAECVRLLRAAGAIPLAVTNVPELNKWVESRNMVFGQTNNPYHVGRTVGGSSGGEAALAAAITVPISMCSDIGGSTRMPAFFCGLFGYNPSAGHTSLKGSLLRSGEDPTMAAIGFVSRHCKDLAPLTTIVAGDKASELGLDRVVDLKKIKFYYLETARDLRVSPVCSDLRKAMSKVIKKLTEDATSTDVAPRQYYHEGFNYMFALWKHAMTKESGDFAKMLTNNKGEVKALIELPKKLLGLSSFTMAAIINLANEQVMPRVNPEWADTLIAQLKDDLTRVLGSDGVLLLPSAPSPAPYHYSLLLRPFNFAYWGISNVLHFPSVQVPLGVNSEGLPLGIQVVAAYKQDALCLAVAKHLEQTFGGFVPPCNIDQ